MKPPNRCVYPLSQWKRCVERVLNVCFMMVIGMLAESSVHMFAVLSLQRGQGGKRRGSKAGE